MKIKITALGQCKPAHNRHQGAAMGDESRILPQIQRSQRLLALSDEKTKAFYARHIGQTMPVLMEKPKAGAPMHGFTANYIRVEVESDAALDNKVVNVLLGDFNEEGTALKGTITQ